MFVVISTGGKQYRVHQGDKLAVERLPGAIGSIHPLGSLYPSGTPVAARIVTHKLGEKVRVRRRRRWQGHRQPLSVIEIVTVG